MVVRGEGFEPSIFADVRQQKIFQALHHCAIPPIGIQITTVYYGLSEASSQKTRTGPRRRLSQSLSSGQQASRRAADDMASKQEEEQNKNTRTARGGGYSTRGNHIHPS